MDLSGSARTPRFPCVSAIFECHTISRVYPSNKTVWGAHFARTYLWELERAWHHRIITIPAELWGLITHILVYLWGLLLAGGMTEKKPQACVTYLSSLAWIFPTISGMHFLAFTFLAIIFWSKKCAITEIEGLMSSGSVTNVTGTLFRMRNTFCWTVRMNILLAFAHSTASWSSHLNMKIAQLN